MEPVPVERLPVLPDAEVLAQGAVSAARYIAQDAVEEQLHVLLRAPRAVAHCVCGDAQHGVDARVEVCDEKRRAREARALVDEEVRALRVAVVGDEEAIRHGKRRGCSRRVRSGRGMESFK